MAVSAIEGENMRFSGKTIIITGAAGTIGKAVAKAFYQEGANLALVDCNKEALERVCREEGWNERTLLLPSDVTDEKQVEEYVAKTVERFGAVDAFFNNAGITGNRKTIAEFDIEHFRKLMDINVTGIALGLKYVLQQMYRQGSGSVINTSSQKGKVFAKGSADYAASKSAVITLTKIAAMESAEKNVRVNCIMPGIVHSKMLVDVKRKGNPDLSVEEIGRSFGDSIPIGRWCEPEELAKAVMFLSSDDASYITGAELHIDGGMTANSL